MGCFGMKLGMGYVVNKVLTLFDAGKFNRRKHLISLRPVGGEAIGAMS